MMLYAKIQFNVDFSVDNFGGHPNILHAFIIEIKNAACAVEFSQGL